MAKKVVKGTTTKVSAKGKRRMKKQARRTLAAVLMISAIVIAAIPVPEANASLTDPNQTVVDVEPGHNASTSSEPSTGSIACMSEPDNINFPDISGQTIYINANGSIRFTYQSLGTGDVKRAVICGLDKGALGADGIYTIPQTIDGYLAYNDSLGSSGDGNIAVNINGHPLFYKRVTKHTHVRNIYDPAKTSLTNSNTDLPDEVYVESQSHGVDNYTSSSEPIKGMILDPDTGEEKEEEIGTKTTITFYTYQYWPCYASDTAYDWNNSNTIYYAAPVNANDKPDLRTLYIKDNGDTKTIVDSLGIACVYESGITNADDKFQEDSTRMINAEIAYVASQTAIKQADGTYQIVSCESLGKGIFSGYSDIRQLIVPESIKGIGQYAFSGCTGIQSISFNPQIRVIGKHAFEGCTNLKVLDLGASASITYFEEDSFRRCKSLETLIIPSAVQKIADGAFRDCEDLVNVSFNSKPNLNFIGNDVFSGCTNLRTVDLSPATDLESVGCHLFKDCPALEEVIFPSVKQPMNNGTFNPMWISMFQGDRKLKHVQIPNTKNYFKDQDDPTDGTGSNGYKYGMVSFIAETGDNGFYFEGYKDSEIHKLAKQYGISFKYMDDGPLNGVYEKVVKCERVATFDDIHGDVVSSQTINIKFQANADGQLISALPDENETIGANEYYHLTIPAAIGPYDITAIGTDFQGNERISQVNIPDTISTIAAEAFKGCYNLNRVYFEDPLSITTAIGTDAFKTQNVTKNNLNPEPKGTPVKLTFEGDISADSFPFQYAMNPTNNINNAQEDANTYIDCYGGAPSNLHVMYSIDKGTSELISVPEYTSQDEGHAVAGDLANNSMNYEYVHSIFEALVKEGKLQTTDITDTSKCLPWINAAIDAYNNGGTTNTAPTGNYTASEIVMKTVGSIYDITVPTGVHALKSKLFSSAIDYSTKDKISDPQSTMSINTNSVLNDTERPYLNAAKAHIVSSYKNNVFKTIVLCDIYELEPYTFYDCDNLTSVKMYNSGSGSEKIGDYAFGYCDNLTEVVLPKSTGTMGIRPFAGNRQLTGVKFGESPENNSSAASGDSFGCQDGIIYGLKNGSKDSVVECLETRFNKDNKVQATVGNSGVSADELAGITSIHEEAFMNVEGISTVDLSKAAIEEVPRLCFARDLTTGKNTNLSKVVLPSTCFSVEPYAFYNCDKLENITLPGSIGLIDQYAFANDAEKVDTWVTVSTTPGSYAERVAKNYGAPDQDLPYHWSFGDAVKKTFTVTFYDETGKNVVDTQLVEEGSDADSAAAAEKLPAKPGYTFKEWRPSVSGVASDVSAFPYYTEDAAEKYTVEFWDYDGTVLVTREINPGESAEEPKSPSRTGWTFTGWSKDFTNVTEDKLTDKTNKKLVTIAQYTQNGSSTDPSGSGSSGSGSGSSGSGSDASGSGSGSSGSTSGTSGSNTSGSASGSGANGSAGGSNAGADTTTYTLTVVNGSGSGSYVAGTTVLIAAYPPTKGYTFNKWTSTDQTTTFANMMASATSITMPAKSITVTANYTNGSGATTSSRASNTGSSTGSVSGNNSTGGNRRTNTGNGTTVDVTKDGISDKNVASATVSGSTDNFVVKVKEDSDALEKVIRALKKQYGDISNFRYVAMDISLYDSTGTKQITDTAGLAVTVTLPLPDELRQYAGNNKVAGVVGEDTLDMLSPTFSTIDDVPCVTFTATHFSPYTIYVDTANLSSGVSDATPKTGDLLQPKWFLSFGLGLLSIVLFLKKDKKRVLA